MRLSIISDIHDNLANLDKCLAWCGANGIEGLICAGDLTNADTLDHLAKNFPHPIYLARGNADNYDEKFIKNYQEVAYLSRDGGIAVIAGCRIGVCHEPFLIDNLLKRRPRIIFYGHTHAPWQENRNGADLVNPGTLGGISQKATFAVYDTASDGLELKILELL
jgi:putative phosphoesterase